MQTCRTHSSITFSNEHLAAKTLPNRKDEKNRFPSKTVLIDNREFQMVIIGDKNSRFSKIQEKAERGLTVQTLLLDSRSDLKQLTISNLILLVGSVQVQKWKITIFKRIINAQIVHHWG